MAIVIQKFGGTSLRNINKESHILSHIKKSIDLGEHPVVVVSAIGRKGEPYSTDTLIEQLEKISNKIDPKKKDLIMSCGETISAAIISHLLESHGISSEPFMGLQAGIITDDNFNSSNILDIDLDNILNCISKDQVPVVAGFQGATKNLEVTTLGRGGSDITAVTLGAYLKADRVDIFTDVPGVAIIDPNIVSSPHYIKSINYDDMYRLASNGANVIHPKAVKIGKEFNIPIQIRATDLDVTGTIIFDFKDIESRGIIGIALDTKSIPNVITVLFHDSYDYHSKNKFEKYLLEDEVFLETIWYHKNKLAIFFKSNKIAYYGEKIYRYFYP